MKKQLPLILVALVLVGAGVYYFLQGKSKSPAVEKMTEFQAVKELATDCKYDKDICAYMLAQAKAMESGVVINTTSKMGSYGDGVSEMKMDGAGNFESNSYLNGKLQSSMVSFEKVTYLKDMTDNAWYAMPSLPADQEKSSTESIDDLKATYQDQAEDLKMTKIGTEACDELTCDKYEMGGIGEKAESKFYVWVDTKEHLARKMEMTFEGGSSVMIYKYESVSVAKPSPIKEMPVTNQGSATTEGMPSQEELEQMMQNYGLDGQ